MSAHTRGPWHRRIGRKGNGTPASQHEQICNEDGVAVVMLEHDGLADGEANVVLMTAAPDLLEVAKGMLAILNQATVGERNWSGAFADQCRAAIAKAEGK